MAWVIRSKSTGMYAYPGSGPDPRVHGWTTSVRCAQRFDSPAEAWAALEAWENLARTLFEVEEVAP